MFQMKNNACYLLP